MKRYYDLNNAHAREYDAVARRGKVEPDFSFVDQLAVVHTNHRSGDKSFSKGKSKELRSLSPSMKYGSKKSNLLGKKLSPGQKSSLEDEIKKLQNNLKNMREHIMEDKMDDKEKLSKVFELIEASLQSKIFKKDALNGKTS
jgi:hypothetical protein